MTSPHPGPGHEEYETMPWATLADEIDKGRNRTMALTVLAAVAVGILAFLAVRAIRQPPGTVVDVPTTAVVTAPVSAPASPAVVTTFAPEAAPVDVTATSDAPDDAVVYSEADLLAGAPDVDLRLAVTRAEWFVTEYFSSGPVGEAVLPDGATPRTIPDGAYSWVEWARAAAATPLGGGRYDVIVVFRTVSGDGERPAAATPVRAVSVPVLVGTDGASSVVDLPSPVAVPGAAAVTALPAVGDVPEQVAAAALGRVGDAVAAEVVGGSPTAGGWRVVVSVTDRSGSSIPMVVHVAE